MTTIIAKMGRGSFSTENPNLDPFVILMLFDLDLKALGLPLTPQSPKN